METLYICLNIHLCFVQKWELKHDFFGPPPWYVWEWVCLPQLCQVPTTSIT